MNLPALFAGASLWLHLSTAMLWTGGMAFFLFVFAPAARALAPAEGIRALERGRQSIQTLSWIAIHVMFLTGVLNFLFRAGAPRDAGYYMILAVKLLLFLAMAFHHSLQVFKYSPKIATAASAAARAGGGDAWPEPLRAPLTKWFMLLKINATLGFIVLLLGLGLSWR
ncbi:MAG TPA: hypothetical protein VGA73_04860 [Candidatus Binatia bacterium]